MRALAGRLGLVRTPDPGASPDHPIGVKLELTHACNLRCGYCYTDSPRHTLARTPDLADDEVRAIVEEAIELGVIEAVVTGGEPLLRRDLALEVIERLLRAGVHVVMNTNGWFVDEAVADRLAAAGPLRIHVSIDGATPEQHDCARGLPGSWRRATRAVALLAERDVDVQVTHVATPANAPQVGDMVELAWLLGASSLVVVTVVPVGAAARGARWELDGRELVRAVDRARRDRAPELAVRVDAELSTDTPARAPRAILVRPDGHVRIDSINPFTFGHAISDGLATCWRRIVADWDHPRVRAWREPLRHGTAIDQLEVVPYRDADATFDGSGAAAAAGPAPLLPAPAASTQAGAPGDPEVARAEAVRLALGRRYRLGDVRASDGGGTGRHVRVAGSGVARLNSTAAVVMDACAGGTPQEAAQRLAERHPDVPRDELERAAIGAARSLAGRRILRGDPAART